MQRRSFLHGFVAFATILWSVGITGFIPSIAFAASSIAVTNGTFNASFPGSPIPASSPAIAALKLSVTASQAGQTLNAVTVNFGGSGFVTSDLAAIATAGTSGVALYNDAGGTLGTFDGGDADVALAASPSWTSATTNITLTPSAPVSLTNGTATIFYVVIKTSASPGNTDHVAPSIPAGGIATSDGSGPSADFNANDFVVDTAPAQIVAAQGFVGSATVNVKFNKPVQKVGGGDLVIGDAPFVYVDGGGSVETIAGISHVAGQDTAILTMSAALDAGDVDGSPATLAAGSNKIADMGGNVIGTTPVPLTSPLTITTATVPTAAVGATYGSGSPLVTMSAVGGTSPYTFAEDTATDGSSLATAGLVLNADGTITGTVADLTGSFPLQVTVTSSGGGTPVSKPFTFNVATSGSTPPGIASVSPSGAAVGTVSMPLAITGTSTHFSTSSSIKFLLSDGTVDPNVTAVVGSSTTSTALSASVTVGSAAASGSRDVLVGTGTEIVTLPNGFGVFAASGSAGLTLNLPADAATAVQLPPGFSFAPSAAAPASYRVTVNTASNFSGTTLWDYAFPAPNGTNDSPCSSTACNLGYGAGTFRLITQPAPLSPNATYYWQVRTYGVSPDSVSDSVAPLESTSVHSFTTTASVTDVTPPSFEFRPTAQAPSGSTGSLTVFARVTDNLATLATTPALTTSLTYCVGAPCTPTTSVSGSSIGNGYFSYAIPNQTNNVVVQYFLTASDGTNTANFKQPDGTTPFSVTFLDSMVVSAPTSANSIAGTVTDGTTAIGGASVFADGTGFRATTASNGTFSLDNLPVGTYDLTILKDGYGVRQMSGIAAGTSGLTIALSSGTAGGFGGDTTAPQIMSSMPNDGMTGLPGDVSNFMIAVGFSKAMSQSTITPTNLLVKKCDASGCGTDITGEGTWTYYATASGLAYVPPVPNEAVWQLNPSSTASTCVGSPCTLGDGQKIAVIVNPTVTDTSGNAVQGNESDGSYAFSFTTGTTAAFSGGTLTGGTFGSGAFIPPHVTGTTPPPGGFEVPVNQKILISFSDVMAADAGSYALKDNVKLYTVSGTTETDVSSTIGSVTLDSAKLNAIVAPTGTLSTGTRYRLKVLGGAQAASGLGLLPPAEATSVAFTSDFQTGSSSVDDTSAPIVTGSYPDNNATGVPVNPGALSVGFDKDMDASTITGSAIYLSVGSAKVNGTVSYDPVGRQAYFAPSAALSSNASYTLTVGASVKAQNGTALAAAVTRTFTTGAASTSPPFVSFANADDSAIAVSFSQPMNAAKATDALNWTSSVLNPANYALEYGAAGFTVGTGTAITSGEKAAASFAYDPVSNTVTVTGYHASALDVSTLIGQELYVAISGVKDLSGNAITTSGATFTARSIVQNSATTKGAMGPTDQSDDAFSSGGDFVPTNFSSATFGFAPPVNVQPQSKMPAQTTGYHVSIPISKQIPAGGSVVLTFPSGFDVSAAAQDVNSPVRQDLNGPGAGTITFECPGPDVSPPGSSCFGGTTVSGDASGDTATKGGAANDGVTVNAALRSVTVYLSAATNAEGHDFLNIDLSGIKNSSIPKDFNTSGYTVDVKTKKADGATVLESMTSQPFFIQSGVAAGGTTYTVSGTVTLGSTASGTAKIYLISPITGPLSTTTADFGGTTTATYSFTNVPPGDYGIFTDQTVSLTSDYAGKAMPDRLNVTGNTTHNFTLGLASSGTNVTVDVTGTLGDVVDVFASSPTGFRVATATLTGGTDAVVLPLPDGSWNLGVGPHMPKGVSGPPSVPDYLPPKPKQLVVTSPNCTVDGTANASCSTVIAFTLTTAGKTIKGIVKDASGNLMVGAQAYAYSPQGGFGTRATTDASGVFSLSVTDGSYSVGAFVPGMPSSNEVPVVVTSDATVYESINGAAAITPANAVTGSTPFVLQISKPSFTISGKVTDGTNTVQGASVHAYRTDGPGNANAFTDASGAYTLYVANGTWKVGAFLPQYGNLDEQTVTVSGANTTNQNFAPAQTGTFHTVSGTVTSGGSPVQGAFVSISGNNTFNQTNTASDGTYSFHVPACSTTGCYSLRASAPNVGRFVSPAAFSVTADVSGKDFGVTSPETVTITTSAIVDNALVDLFSTTGAGAHVSISNGTSGTAQLADGTYQVKVNVPGTNIGLTDVSGTGYDNTTGIFTVNASQKTLTVTLPATLRTVIGTVTASASNVADAWVDISDVTTGIHFGTQTTGATTGSTNFSLQVPDGTYDITVSKSGYSSQTTSFVVSSSATTVPPIALATSSTTITGQVLIGSTGAANAFVRAQMQGGGFATAQADASGNYTLPVSSGSWTVYAVADGYEETAATGIVDTSGGSVTGVNITLSTVATVAAPASTPMTPASGGTLSDAASGTDITIPASALGTSTSAGNVQETETTNIPSTSTAIPLDTLDASGAYVPTGTTISATDSSNNPIQNLKGTATVDMTYTPAELAATPSATDSSINTTAEADQIKMAYWDSTNQNWTTLPSTVTYKDASGNVVTSPASDLSNVSKVTIAAATTHFSTYAPIVSTDPSAPATAPSGLAAAASGTGAIRLNWTADTAATNGYDIYRSTTSGGTYTRVGSEPTVSAEATATYLDSGLLNSTTYYYEITAINSSGESVASSAVHAQTAASASSSGGSGGGGGGGYVAPPAPTCSITAPAAAASWSAGVVKSITWTSSGSGIDNVLLSYSADGGATYGVIASGRSNSGTYSWIVPNAATANAMVKVECRDASGSDLATATSGAFTIVGSSPASVTTPVVTPVVTLPSQASPVAVLIRDPSQLDALLASVGSTRSVSSEAKYSALIHSDALQFKVGLTAAQLATVANFVTYGASAATVKLGSGERRALIRDYFETVGRANVSWDDIQRLTTGQKPVGRNLALEQAKVGAVLKVFVKFVGHNPVFSNSKEDIAWNTLMYRIRFPRDLAKERVGILKFEKLYKRVPTSPLDWAAVRAWGYELQ